jgi:carboxymethylenebutenolidase
MKRAVVMALGLILIGCGADEGPTAGAAASAASASVTPQSADDGPPPITAIPPAVPVIAEEVAYGETELQNLRGYMVLPADAVDVPGVIMIHEWWGLNDNVRAMARRLAGEGYAVLAIDLFGGQTATRTADADRLMSAVMRDRQAALANIRQAYRYLDEFVLTPRIGVLGWSLGGGWALEAGLDLGDSLDAVVMFYGEFITDPELLMKLEAPLLGIFAGEDESIPAREVLLFKGRLQGLGKTADVQIYAGLAHAFADPGSAGYDHESALRAWSRTLEFLDERLR